MQIKVGGVGDRFDEQLLVCCAWLVDATKLTNTKLTQPNTKISKSSEDQLVARGCYSNMNVRGSSKVCSRGFCDFPHTMSLTL